MKEVLLGNGTWVIYGPVTEKFFKKLADSKNTDKHKKQK